MTGFFLHPRLAADGLFIADWDLCRVLLMKDARFSWLILVPRVAGAAEIFDLDQNQRHMLVEETARAGAGLKNWAKAGKINIGALGNLVPQLHVHVVARHTGDAAWPGPVWGSGPADPYPEVTAARVVTELREAL